jgi:hypothetical protein
MFCHLDDCDSAKNLPTECDSAILVPPQGTKYIGGELQKNSSSCREKHFQEEEKSPKMAKK